VVASNNDDARHTRQLQQGPPDNGFGLRRRCGRIEEISGDNRQVDTVVGGQADNLVEDQTMLCRPVVPADSPTNMPIGCMENFHCHDLDRIGPV
jgi:hypothetical protein